jgi:hypothetical protein
VKGIGGRAFAFGNVGTAHWLVIVKERSGHHSLSLSKQCWHVQELDLLLLGTQAGLSTKHSLQHKTQRACHGNTVIHYHFIAFHIVIMLTGLWNSLAGSRSPTHDASINQS